MDVGCIFIGHSPRLGREHLESHPADLLAIHGAQGLGRPLLRAEEGVAALLPVEEVEIYETSEPGEHVLDHVDGGQRGAADEEEPLYHRALSV